MRTARTALLLVSVLVMFSIWGFIGVYRGGYIPKGLDVFIFVFIMVGGVYAFVTHLRQHKDVKKGFPAEDELSARIKYKAGYYAFISSLYIWLFIFLFNSYFSDVETMLGGGILLSGVTSMAIRGYLTRNYHEDQD